MKAKYKTILRLISVVLTALMVASIFTITSFAAETTPYSGTFKNSNCTYNLDSNGRLTISGKGEVYSTYFMEADNIFYQKDKINEVILDEGITKIFRDAFTYFKNLYTVRVLSDDCEIYNNETTIPNTAIIFCGYKSKAREYADKYNKNAMSLDGYYFIPNSNCGWRIKEGLGGNRLEFEGEGAIPSYPAPGTQPWWNEATTKKISYIIIKPGITKINTALSESSTLISIVIPNTVTYIGANILNGSNVWGVHFDDGGDDALIITENAFAGCKQLEDIIIPQRVKSLHNIFGESSNLKEITLNEGLLAIGEKALNNNKITELTIPASVVRIQKDAIYNCSDLKKITFLNPEAIILLTKENLPEDCVIIGDENSTAQKWAEDNGFEFVSIVASGKVSDDNEIVWRVLSGKNGAELQFGGSGEIPIYWGPASQPWYLAALQNQTKTVTILNTGIEKIPSRFMSGIGWFETVNISESVKVIDSGAFVSGDTSDSNLQTINFSDGSEELQISEKAFYNSKKLKEVNIPARVKTLTNAFEGCDNIEKITLNEGLETIKEKALNSNKITELTIPKSVTAIEKDAVYNCNDLKEITFLNPDCSIELVKENLPESCKIYGYDNSTAQEWAKDNGFEFVSKGVSSVETTETGDKTPEESTTEEIEYTVETEATEKTDNTVNSEPTESELAETNETTETGDTSPEESTTEEIEYTVATEATEKTDNTVNSEPTESELAETNATTEETTVNVQPESSSLNEPTEYIQPTTQAETQTTEPSTGLITEVPTTEAIEPITQPATQPATQEETKSPVSGTPSLSKKSVTLKVGESTTITVNNGEALVWDVSNSKVVKIDNGKITALKTGTTTITAFLSDGTQLTCKVTVKAKFKLAKPKVKQKSKTKKSVTLTWKKVKKADGYKIYRYNKKWKLLKTLKKTSYKFRFKKAKKYKLKVCAYKKIKSKVYYSKARILSIKK